ncbi:MULTISPECIES: OPT family oligopeptide transporter [unclassified Gordonia (in: high G+C Gram-positive bacteria)]|uniref:OPT family oligopeptide transporter n=1 Tax=unclassified Gordonia (in: high G+C Gram-positive bacteria) TaxID=2657482 RepID=UPI0007EC1482|nr:MULTISPECIES: oligopeptide transporter, OPT family [unclassified Gordonia (in: high G+C Gram-positive bacteria)]OBC08084.1 oligopeptide transporter, OPT family [Gordonia sp. 852002-50395_SCH5434458]OBC13456.1 oligopeptide transporter, OPT family [Gordonia sp. 852002-50816_SCH5313054-a]OBC16499.1 oligopeptide transporter, OPT family [Gordonia sp. 852002-50816_SCH5313054-c]
MSVTAHDRPTSLRELTLRGVVLGGVITLVFTAANVYLGLKVGLTFATAIPAAVISMAVLRNFAHHSIVENNIVQTIASAAGTLSAIIFVIPGLVMVGYWTGFPYWITVAVCLVGGILGVMYSIPLRRALVTGSDLPYPEGVAAAEVLKVGDTAEGGRRNRIGLRAITISGITSAIFALLGNLKLISTDVSTAFRVGSGGTMVGAGLQLSLIGIGHLVGLTVGLAMFLGVIISYGVILPIKSAGQFAANSDVADVVSTVFKDDVRFVGAGAIAIAAIWTLLKLIAPIVKGIVDALASARARREGVTVDITERDIPFPIVGGTIVFMLLPIGLLLWDFVHGTALSGTAGGIIAATVLFIFIIGMVIAAVCGYMAGLIGSSNSPISGVGILAVIIAALLIKFVYGAADPAQSSTLVAFTLFATAIVFGVATISNDNLQDLKTGQLVGATPWKQQVALIIGVCFGSLVIPPILGVMNTAFGFDGAPGAGADALPAPQASLISELAKGVFGNDLNWPMLGLGVAIGAVVIVIDEVGHRINKKVALPPLAVGMGMYLPMSVTLMITVGAILGHFYNKWCERVGGDVAQKKRIGVLVATGLIVGEALWSVVYAGIVAATGDDNVLAIVGDGWANGSQIVGVIAFVIVVLGMYKVTEILAKRSEDDDPAPDLTKK